MLQAALLGNKQVRPDVFGTRHFETLPLNRKPLPTHPPIVGSTWYNGGNARYGVNYGVENPGTEFIRSKLSKVRAINPDALKSLVEPNQNSPARY